MEHAYWKPDTGWSWVVMTTSFLSNVIIDGIHSAFGMFVPELLFHFEVSHSSVAWTYSLMGGIMGLSGVSASVFINQFGPRRAMMLGAAVGALGLFLASFASHFWMLIATVGFITGAGFGLSHLCPFVVTGEYFLKRRSLAMGVITSGSGIGSFIIPPLASVLISAYSWRGALVILAGVTLNGIAFGATFMPVPRKSDQNEKKALLNYALLRRPSLLIHCLSCYLSLTGIFVFMLFLPDFAKSRDVPQHQRALLLSVFGAVSTVVRLLVGFVSDRTQRVHPAAMLFTCLVCGGGLSSTLGWVHAYSQMALCAAGVGAAMGAMTSLMPILVIRLQGPEYIADCFGFIAIACGLASLLGSPIAGGLYDATGSYTLAFCLAGGAIVVAGLLAVPMAYCSQSHFTGCCSLEATITVAESDTLTDKLDNHQSTLIATTDQFHMSGHVRVDGSEQSVNSHSVS